MPSSVDPLHGEVGVWQFHMVLFMIRRYNRVPVHGQGLSVQIWASGDPQAFTSRPHSIHLAFMRPWREVGSEATKGRQVAELLGRRGRRPSTNI
jgi:hypothetical protein